MDRLLRDVGRSCDRIFAGNQPKNETWGDTVARCVKACESACEYAHKKGVYLGLEKSWRRHR
jgi:hypothetical protein